MKIISQGGKWSLKLTCKGCKAVLEAEAEDVRYGLYSENYEDEFEGKFYVQCPNCSRKNVKKDIPDLIAEDIKANRSD